jgi:hypothetical protein
MELITKSEFARLCGVSAPHITQEIKRGNLPVVGCGRRSRIDLSHKAVIFFMNGVRRNSKPKLLPPVFRSLESKPIVQKPRRKKSKPKQQDPDSLKVFRAEQTLDPKLEDQYERQNNYSGGLQEDDEELTYQFSDDAPYQIPPEYAQHVKTVESIRQIRIKTAKEEGSLINRDLVKRVLAEIYTVDVNQWKTLAANLAAKLAAAYGKNDDKSVRAAEKIVDMEVHSILEHTKRIIDGFVESTREGKK